MQTVVRSQPRTGREPIWQYQIYRGNEAGPFDQGQLFDFEAVLEKIRVNKGKGLLIRIMGPSDATREQLEQLRELGAHPTFPA